VLRFDKKTQYALMCLAYLAEHPQRACSREVAGEYALPLPIVMNLLKLLHRSGWVSSERGVKGGYRLAVDLQSVSLHDLMRCLGRPEPEILDTIAPLAALRFKLGRFLKDVKLSDLVLPGRRIDVPVELVGVDRSRVAVTV